MSKQIRNIAIIAHVDHGKTTMVDQLLRQSGTFAEHEKVVDTVMDNNAIEKERGITILAKNCAVSWEGTHINIVDTPGHADFGGEVERALSMVDGVVLLVDASEGPLPQTRFVLRKALEAQLPVILLVNKTDRPDARIAEVVDETYELFFDLDADEEQIQFPIVYASAKAGRASLTRPVDGGMPDEEDLEPLFATLIGSIPAPTYDPEAPLQAHVTNLDSSPYLGRLALCRVINGNINKGQQVAWMKSDGTTERGKIVELLMTEAEKNPNVTFHFSIRSIEIDKERNEVLLENLETQEQFTTQSDVVFATDGAYSALRGSMVKTDRFDYSQQYLPHGYKELSIPPAEGGGFLLEPNALHIWPRKSFMLIALPNLDGSFTCTLFLAFEGEVSFEHLKTESQVEAFFKEHFADVVSWKRSERDQVVHGWAQRYAQRLGEHCLDAPLQWFNFYPFWNDDDNKSA